LAISIDTVHGHLPGKPRLDFACLVRIRETVNVPWVIHGGTGLSDQQYQNLIDHGVVDVQIGQSVNERGKYRYCWLIRFASEQVIESDKTHPIHVAYADTFFRPVAMDRITNDYVILDDLEFRQQLPARAVSTLA
jgi:hypothetical protein